MFFFRSRFHSYGKNSLILNPLKVDGKEYISIGDNVTIHDGTWLAAVPLTGMDVSLEIGDGTILGHFNHIFATHSIRFGKKVLTADKVYISDNVHCYDNINSPIIEQGIKQCSPVVIGDGSWIGENVCIIGASIGMNCVIGSNSVVTHDIPNYCVAVGIPARVIKHYDIEKKEWIRNQ